MKKIFNRILKGDSGGKEIIWEAGLVVIAVLVLFWSRDSIDHLKMDTVNQGNKKTDWIFEGGKPSNGDDVEIEHTHWYSDYTIIKHPTCLDPGKAIVKCTCGDEKEIELPPLGHNFVDGECTRCGLRDPILDRSTMILSGPEFNATIPAEATSIVFVGERLEDEDFTIDVSAAQDKGVVAWLDGTVYKVSTQRPNVYAQANTNASEMFSNQPQLTSINFGHLRTEDTEDMSRMFYASTELTELDLTKFNTEKTTNMSGMFAGTDASGNMNLNKITFGTWNTENVKDMSSMFQKCASLQTVDVSNWDVKNVEAFNSMFTQCTSLESVNVSNWDTSSATSMYAMFNQCGSLENINTSGWKTGNVTNMGWMFYGCTNLSEINVSNWDVMNVESTHAMFYNCRKVDVLDVSGWNVSNIKDMSYMFNRCEKVSVLDTSKWVTTNAETMQGMFYGCEHLEELDLIGFDMTNVTSTSNMFDECIRLKKVAIGEKFDFVSNDGYFPSPNSTYIDNADGRWYNTLGTVDRKGTAYSPNNVKDNIKEIYVATNPMRDYVVKHWIQKIGANASILNDSNYEIKEIEYGDELTGSKITPSVKTYEGFTSPSTQTVVVADDNSTVVNYYYTRNKYSVTLTVGKGIVSVSGDGLYEFDQKVEIDAVVDNGYTWKGWTGTLESDKQKYEFNMPATNVENTATTTINKYSITYNPNGGTLPSDTVYEFTVEDTIELPKAVKPGYTFDGWYENSNLSGEKIEYINKEFGDKEFYAKWIIDEYRITYETNNGELPDNVERTYTVENHVILAEPTREGANFAGWYKDEEFKDGPKTSTDGEIGDITYYAKWDLINYNISYEPNGGIMPDSYRTTYNIEDHATLPIPTKEYYNFAGWCKIVDCSDTPVTTTAGEIGDLRYYAKWIAEDYNIIYETNGGELPNDTETTYNIEKEVVLPTPTRNGYEFGGWYTSQDFSGNKVTKIPFGSHGEKVFYAKWYEIIPFAIYSETDNSLMFYVRGDEAVVGEMYNERIVTAKYTDFNTETYKPTQDAPWFENRSKIRSVTIVDEVSPVNTAAWFYEFNNCKTFDLEKLNTSKVTDMSYMFYNAGYDVDKLQITGLDKWNTSKVENMYSMFYMTGHESNEIVVDNLTEWNVSNVKDMSFMFTEMAYSANSWSFGSLKEWNMQNVTSTYGMFNAMAFNAVHFDLGDIGNWNTSNVVDMAFMFGRAGKNATTWNIGDISNWNVEKVSNMDHMFQEIGHGISDLSLDLSGWNTISLINSNNMFSYANISELYLDNFNMSKANKVEQMFAGCHVLEKVSIGENFEFIDPSGYLPEPDKEYINEANGKWYNLLGTRDEIGTEYSPDEIPNNIKEVYIVENPSTDYVVKHFIQKLDGDYELKETENLKGVKNKEITPNVKEYEGFSAPEKQTVLLKEDGSTVVNYYYTRNEYSYNIIYKSNTGVQIETGTVKYLYGTTNTVNPKDFDGYTKPESQVIAWDDVNAKTITFIYAPIEYTITIDCAGGSGVSSSKYTVETATFSLGTPNKTGYTFTGWTGSNGSTPQTNVSIVKGSFGDKTYTANWSAVSYSIEYNLNGGTNPDNAVLNYTIEQNVTLPIPTKIGHTFDGWYVSSDLSGEKVTSIEIGSYGNKVFYAGWKANEYTYNVIYESINGIRLSTGTVSYLFGSTNVVNPKEFDGYTSPESQTIVWNSVEAKEIVFKYTPIEYNVTINCAGGSGVSSSKYTIETETFSLGTPSRTGYTFTGWTGSNGATPQTSVSIAKGSTGDKTYTANWSAVSYSIKYNLNGGVNPGDAILSYTTEDRVVLPTPNKNGYEFTGWFESSDFGGEKVSVIEVGSIGDKEYYANWTIVEYEIKYNLNGGTNPDNANLVYTIESGATLPSPTKPGHVFAGWYETSDFSGEVVNSIEIGTYGNKEFYAKWAEIEIYAIYSETDNSLMFYENADAPVVGSEYNEKIVTKVYKDFNDVEERNENNLPWNDEYKDDIVEVIVVDEIAPKNTSYWFYDFTNCASFDLANLDVSDVTDMSYMFAKSAYNVSSFKINGIESWNVSNVEDMYSMFYQTGYNANKFELNLSSWIVSSVVDMSFMFDQSGYKSVVWTVGTLNNWDVSNVENMNSMFNAAAHNANTFDIGDLKEWDVLKVENMSYMFAKAGENSTIWNVGDISNWNVSNVKLMDFLFHSIARGTDGIELDLSGWETSSLTNANNMFSYANISELYLDSFDTSKVINMERMFGDCRLLEIVSIGSNFKFVGENGYFPVIDEEYVARADGKWYNTLGTVDAIGTAYLPNEVYDNVREIYTSISPIAKYTVLHWGQKVGGNAELKNEGNYDVIETQEFRALIDSEQSPEIEEYEGFTSPTQKESVVVLEDNSAVVNYYYTRNTYTVTLNVGEYIESVIGAGTYQFEQSVTINANVKNGYQWKEWTGEYNTTDQEYTFEMPAKDIELTANGDVIVYSLEFEPNGGIMPSDVPAEYSEKDVKTLPSPTKEGYTFGGWYESSDYTGTALTTTNGLAGNKVLYAKWNANLYTYNIVYKSTSGVIIETDEFSNLYGETILVPAKPLDGYTKPEDKEVVWDSITPKEIVFTYTPIEYVISIDCNGGYGVEDITYNIETTTFTIDKPNKTGYGFTGWTGSNGETPEENVIIRKGSFGNKSYSANWSAVEYSIRYELNGGTNPDNAISVYTIESGAVLPEPTREQYMFDGWYETSDFSGEVITNIEIGTYGNKVFFAKWTEITTFAIYSETDHSLMFYEDPDMPKVGEEYNDRIVTEIYIGFDDIKEKDINKVPWQNENVSNIEKVVVVDEIVPTNTAYWFYDFVNCSSFDVTNLNVSNVTDMTYMFAKSGYNTDSYIVTGITEWDTSKVESMYAMFHMAGYTTQLFELNLNLLDTSSVTDMSFMLDQAGYNAIHWTVENLSSWEIEKVKYMNSMFNSAGYNANEFNLGDLGAWDVSNVENMDYMFGQAGRNSVLWNVGDISQWDVSNTTSMSHMFQSIANGSEGMILDLSGWITSSLTNTNNMFAYANVSELYLNSFDMTNVTDMYRMFSDCVLLEKISIGEKFKFIDLNSYFPVPDDQYIDGANGNWYNTVGTGYAPEDVPEGISDTYIAINPEATYVVKHWVEDIYAGGGSPKMKIAAAPETNDEITYSIREIEVKTGIAGSVVSPSMKDYDGFTPESSRKTAKIKGDGSLVIDYYYSRNKYNVKLEAGEGIDSVIGEGTYKYGETVSVLAYIEAGCTFYGWTGDLESEDERYIFEMPAKDILLIAKAEYNQTVNSFNPNRETYNNGGLHEHSYEIKNQVESTCIQEGYIEYYCECGDNYIEYSENENTNHGNCETYTMITVDPTCGSDGKMVEICSGCGDVIKESVIPSTENHDMDEWGTCYICGTGVE